MSTVCSEQLFFKLGVSKDPVQRLRQVAAGTGVKMPPDWNREPVDLVAVRYGGLAEERRMHGDLQEYRVYRTEWFVGVWAVADYILTQNAWTAWPPEPAYR